MLKLGGAAEGRPRAGGRRPPLTRSGCQPAPGFVGLLCPAGWRPGKIHRRGHTEEMRPCSPYPAGDRSSETGTLGSWTRERAGAVITRGRVARRLPGAWHLPLGSCRGACRIPLPPRATESLPVKNTQRGWATQTVEASLGPCPPILKESSARGPSSPGPSPPGSHLSRGWSLARWLPRTSPHTWPPRGGGLGSLRPGQLLMPCRDSTSLVD